MHRSLFRVPFRLFADSFYRLKVPKKGEKNVTHQRIQYIETNSKAYGRVRYESKPITYNLQVEIVNALRLGKRDEAVNLLWKLSSGSDSLRDDDFIYILEYCAKAPDPVFVLETWSLMKEKEIGMKKKCHLFVIQALAKGNHLDVALNLLEFLGEQNHMKPDLHMYNVFLNACVQMQGDVHVAQLVVRCLKLMEDRLMGKSPVTYVALLKLAEDLSAVHSIWKEFTKYYSPSISCLRHFISSFTRFGDLASACRALQHMVALVLQGDHLSMTSAEAKYRSSRLNIPIPVNHDFDINKREKHASCVHASHTHGAKTTAGEDDIQSIELYMSSREKYMLNGINCLPQIYSCSPLFAVPNQGDGSGSLSSENDAVSFLKRIFETGPVQNVLRWSFNDILHACGQSANYELADHLFQQMQKLGVEPSCFTYDRYIKVVVMWKGVADGMEVLKAMKKKNLKPFGKTLANLSIGCSKILKLDLAEALLDQIVEAQYLLYPCRAFLGACDDMDKPERAICVLAKMKKMKVKFDMDIYELLYSLFVTVNAPYEKGDLLSRNEATERLKAIETDMVENGFQHSPRSIQNLLKSLGAEGMTTELRYYLDYAGDLFGGRKPYRREVMCNIAIHSLVDAKENDKAIHIFRQMISNGLQPDAATYTIMVDCCSNIRCYKSACAIVSLMIRDGFFPGTSTYTTLIKILLASQDFDEALRLLNQLRVEGNQPDVLLFNTFLREAYIKGRIDLLEYIVERMHQENIQPDPTTCSYVFSAYMDCNFISTAIEALQVLSMRMISEDENVLEEKRKDLEEDFILAENSEAEFRIIKLFKFQENLAAALLNLRWIEVCGFSISWQHNESAWAKRLSSAYGSGVLRPSPSEDTEV
ncbi:pentatricopeptide repeat-containing protein At1g76280-like [Papaver somniferum]|nr:pentatricopeptide repeat-containing protein At1g76280-like [Papaver somniferum]